MKNIEKEVLIDNLKLAQAFEVEELEERVEFRKWNEHVSLDAEVGGTNGNIYIKDISVTGTIYF
ncbi:MAG: hypothetical protein OXH57_12390 [Ekhidna sp.]|nr:hypothetical protein [Ekhidna sp.]